MRALKEAVTFPTFQLPTTIGTTEYKAIEIEKSLPTFAASCTPARWWSSD
jgi:hypothetical protein